MSRWVVFEELPEYPAISVVIIGHATRDFAPLGFRNLPPIAVRYRDGAGPLLVSDKAWRQFGRWGVRMLLKDPHWYQGIHELLQRRGQRLRTVTQQLNQRNHSIESTTRLLRSFQRIQATIDDVHLLRGIIWAMEQPHEYLSEALIKELGRMIRRQRLHLDPAQVLATLSTPTNRIQLKSESEEILRFAAKQGELKDAELQAVLDQYGDLTYGMVGPSQTLDELRQWIKEARQADPATELANRRRLTQALRSKQQRLFQQLRPTPHQRLLLKLAQWIGYDKGWSKEIQFAAHAARDRVLKELGRRMNLTLKQLRWTLPGELEQIVAGRGPSADELNQRWKNSALVMSSRGFRWIPRIELDAFDQTIDDRHTELDYTVTELRGRPAVAGTARGIVKRIESPADIPKMNQGDILISAMTIPEIVPAMRKAAAIVTDEGGLTCHAAIVSRELGIPCLIGTKIVTKIFHDGDLAEVNTAAGFIRKVSE